MNVKGSGRRRRNAGFSLIEIMVVVIILGILAATILPNFVGTTQEAKVTTARVDIRTLQGALERFNLNMDRYPSSEEGLNVLVKPPLEGSGKWRGPYIEKVNLDPWKFPYAYRTPGQHGTKAYDLWSRGADGADGGEGVNADVTSWGEE